MRTEEEGVRAAAARAVLAETLAWQARGGSLAHAILGGGRPGGALRHIPRHDLVDARAGTRAYFHLHRHPGDPAGEWGHFHLFVEDAQGYSHLAALVLDARGWPLRWVATSTWVTGGQWRTAQQLAPLLASFSLQGHGRLASVARWLSAMVALFQPQLLQLLRRRDRTHAGGRDGPERARLASCSARLERHIAVLAARTD